MAAIKGKVHKIRLNCCLKTSPAGRKVKKENIKSSLLCKDSDHDYDDHHEEPI